MLTRLLLRPAAALRPAARLQQLMPPVRQMTSLKLQQLKARPRLKKPRPSKPETPSLNTWEVKLADLVVVNQGPAKGERGVVIERRWRENQVVVEGVNMSSKRVLDMDSDIVFNPQYKTEREAQPLHYTHVSLIDPESDHGVSVRWEKRKLEDGRVVPVRISTESGLEIPLPGAPGGPPRPDPLGRKPLVDYAESLSTRRHHVLEVTYKPLPEYSMRRMREAAAAAGEEAPTSSESPPPDASPAGPADAPPESRAPSEK